MTTGTGTRIASAVHELLPHRRIAVGGCGHRGRGDGWTLAGRAPRRV